MDDSAGATLSVKCGQAGSDLRVTKRERRACKYVFMTMSTTTCCDDCFDIG